ncbi:hypothetical protein MnTg04_01564 [bacterium MnTg04]|nr:hypothetical protein MnTg04_01564 [bacterium MnTg04]
MTFLRETIHHRVIEAQPVQIAIAAFNDRLTALEYQPGPGARSFAGPDLRGRAIAIDDAFDQDLAAAAACLVAGQPRRYHAGIVEHQQIAGVQEIANIGKPPVMQCAVGAIEAQQTAGAALLRRFLGDQRLR